MVVTINGILEERRNQALNALVQVRAALIAADS
jgi:hypothetical protein